MLRKVNPFFVVVWLLLVFLASCSQVNEISVESDILGTATLNFSAGDDPATIESQALVNGIGFSILGRTVIDFDG